MHVPRSWICEGCICFRNEGITMRTRRSSLDISSEDWFIIPPLPDTEECNGRDGRGGRGDLSSMSSHIDFANFRLELWENPLSLEWQEFRVSIATPETPRFKLVPLI